MPKGEYLVEGDWGYEIEIKRQTEDTGKKQDCRGDSFEEKGQGQGQEKEKCPSVSHVKQRPRDPSSGKLCSFEIGSESPCHGCTK